MDTLDMIKKEIESMECIHDFIYGYTTKFTTKGLVEEYVAKCIKCGCILMLGEREV